ncbi:hypothetical protein YTPLAS73_10080 [Nitrosarchaeum sp.]|nr:hypothetical protein YTPLAS73_10080 [Nitrosarchaeum sp.]
MSEQEKIMDNLLNVDLEIIDCVRALQEDKWNSDSLKQQVDNLLRLRDDMVEKLISLKDDDHECGCGHKHE